MRNVDSMDAQDIAERLAHHSAGDGGLLHTLRPYVGSVDTTATKEILDLVRRLTELAEKGVALPIAALSGVFHITHTVRRWALDKDGMLVRNNLILPSDWDTLKRWTDEVEEEFAKLLGTLEDREAGQQGGT